RAVGVALQERVVGVQHRHHVRAIPHELSAVRERPGLGVGIVSIYIFPQKAVLVVVAVLGLKTAGPGVLFRGALQTIEIVIAIGDRGVVGFVAAAVVGCVGVAVAVVDR